MGFRKPFRAAPVRLGPYHQEQKRRRSRVLVVKTLGWAGAFGLAVGMLSTEGGRAQVANLLRKASAPATLTRANNPPAGAYYSRCAEARAAGVAPLLADEPGYRPELDADGDGIACEPYYGA